MRIPFLKNFRRGFATNSSSSHSFVYLKEDGELGTENPGGYIDSEFGWNDFRLNTIREKLFYVLVGKIGGGWGETRDGSQDYDDMGESFPELTEADFNSATQGYIDHESAYMLSEDEARDPRLVVFGGNDNGGYSQERGAAVRAMEIDWSRTAMEIEDLDHLQKDDVEGQKAARELFKEQPWLARSLSE